MLQLRDIQQPGRGRHSGLRVKRGEITREVTLSLIRRNFSDVRAKGKLEDHGGLSNLSGS